MRWVRSGGSREEMFFTSEEPDYKKLVDINGLVYHIDREKVSAIYAIKRIRRPLYQQEPGTGPQDMTVFIVDGVQIEVNIHIDNAHTWLTSWKDG